MAAKDRQRGKALELTVGRIFGGRRRRNGEGLGFDDCIGPDGGDLPISIECKAYSTLQLRSAWIAQAIRNARGRPWLLVQRSLRSRQILVTLPLKTLIDPKFHELLQQLTTNPTEEEPSEGEAASA